MRITGWGGNEEKDTTLTGVVETPVSLAGPHATMKVRVDGKLWDVTLARRPAPKRQASRRASSRRRNGHARGRKEQDAGKLEIKTKRVTWNNKLFNVYPEL
jgi:hypothetical protein